MTERHTQQLRHQILESLHSMDHLGQKPLLERIAGEFYWPTMKRDIKRFCQLCIPCKKTKPGKRLSNVGFFKVLDRRFSHVIVDIVGPLPDSYGYKYLLTAVCRTTRYLQAVPIREPSAAEAATAFLHGWLAFFGIPSVVSSDRGGSFTASLWKEMMAKLNIDIKYSAAYRPESQGRLERQYRDIKTSLKAALEDLSLRSSMEEMAEKFQNKGLDQLPWVLLGKRVTLQQDLGASPCELTMGLNVRIPGQILRDPGSIPSDEDLKELLHQVRTNTSNPPVPTRAA